MTWTAPRTWVAGEKPSAATMNLHIRDNLKTIGDPWASFVTSWTGTGGNPAIGNGSIAGGSGLAGKWARFWIHITAGSTTTFGSGIYQLSLPYPETPHRWSFEGVARVAGSSYRITGERIASGLLTLRADPTVAGNPLRSMTNTVPATFTNGDEIFISGEYEAA